MTDLHRILAQHDPGLPGSLSDLEISRLQALMRQSPQPAFVVTRAAGALALIAVLALFLVALMPRSGSVSSRSAALEQSSLRTRELQVTTPGGTRVIWIFRDSQ